MLATIFFAIDPEPLNMPLLWKGGWLGTVFMAIGLGSLIAFLEEGQNDDWFTSVFIQRCFTLAVIFIHLFIICELVSKHPVVDLRLLMDALFDATLPVTQHAIDEAARWCAMATMALGAPSVAFKRYFAPRALLL